MPTHDAGDLSRPSGLVKISDQGAVGNVIEANYAVLLRDDEHVLVWKQLGPDYHLSLLRSALAKGILLDLHEVLITPHVDQCEHFLERVALIVQPSSASLTSDDLSRLLNLHHVKIRLRARLLIYTQQIELVSAIN